MFVADMHCDTLMNSDEQSALVKKYNVSEKHPFLQFFANFHAKAGRPAEVRHEMTFKTLNLYDKLASRAGLFRIHSRADAKKAFREGLRSSLFSIEGGGGLLASSPELDELYLRGLRVLGPIWDDNELGTSAYAKDDTGLTLEGKRLISRALDMGIIIDSSHMSDKAFYQLCELTDKPFLATHSNYRAKTGSKRNLTFDMAKELSRRGGLAGINIYPEFLNDSGKATVLDILRHIDYALENFGDTFVAFGGDIDGTYGLYPEPLSEDESIHDVLIELLLKHYSETTVRRIAGENVMNFLIENLE
ncbi:MAG: membrane dipeptidase [Clostridia bacterium]|nr:membrane dipeptidase [Clostridia bacterium]MBQ8720096.1 membrane dipeptidase [Clostridia bacterium]